MNELRTRLAGCFATVFPLLPKEQIQQASPLTVPEWNSVSTITLANVIEEEFGPQIDLEDFAELDSFEAIAAYLASRAMAAGH